MNNPLDVPAELLHLVEKRDSEADRRQAERRQVESALDEDTVEIEPDIKTNKTPPKKDKDGKDRRDSKRRQESRREQDD